MYLTSDIIGFIQIALICNELNSMEHSIVEPDWSNNALRGGLNSPYDLVAPRYYIRVASYGDYDGSSSVHVANQKAIMDEINSGQDSTLLYVESGHFGGKLLVLDFAGYEPGHIDPDNLDMLLDILTGLHGYPVVDDMTLSEVEHGIIDEYWQGGCGILEDVIYRVANHINKEFNTDLDTRDIEETLTTDQWRSHFDFLNNTYDSPICEYVFEQGDNVWIDLDHVFKTTEKEIIPEHLKRLVESITQSVKESSVEEEQYQGLLNLTEQIVAGTVPSYVNVESELMKYRSL